MTREDAINIMKIIVHMLEERYDTERVEDAVNMAIKSLEQEPCEPCEDCISRQAVLNTLNNMDKVLDEDRTVENYKDLLKECYEVLPFVTPKTKVGKWIYNGDVTRCSNCKCAYDILFTGSNYCPNCGAKMEGENKG
jgi:hypothetical protein